MILGKALSTIPGERRAWIEGSEVMTFAGLREAGVRLPATPRAPRVALRLTRVGSALRALCSLDGRANAIVLLSPTLEPSRAAALVKRARCDWVLSDVDAAPVLGDAPVLRWPDQVGPAAQPDSTAQTQWIMSTSGTTAEPKLVRHTLASLTRSAKLDPARGDGVRWGLLYDYTRFAGLQVVLQSLLSGATLLVPARGASSHARLEMLAAHGCTHLGGTPSLWRSLLMSPSFEHLRVRQITLGGEIVDDRILAVLQDRFPSAGIRHIYASTEAGVGFTVQDGRAGFPRAFLDRCEQGVELKVVDHRLHIRKVGEHVSYVGRGERIRDEDGFVDTGDLVEVLDDRVYFKGRAAGVINVGGDKVHPEVVEGVLLEHTGVAMARVYSRANPITGSVVAADIVAAAGGEDSGNLLESVRNHCRSRLARAHQPMIVRVVERIAVTGAGKLARG